MGCRVLQRAAASLAVSRAPRKTAGATARDSVHGSGGRNPGFFWFKRLGGASPEARSQNFLVGIDAPQFLLLDVSLEPVAVDQAPVAVATADIDDHARLKRCGHVRRSGG